MLPKFINQKLFEEALIHRSYLNEINENRKTRLSSNERLEFLGDSVLSVIVSALLFRQFPQYEEGQLTNLRSNLVKTLTLAKVAKSIDLGKLIKMSKGEEQSGGRENPSLLADTYEALLGALYLDQGLRNTEEFIKETLFLQIPLILKKGSLKDHKSLLQEFVQNRMHSAPIYRVENESGPDHAKTFTVGVYVNSKKLGEGTGLSKQKAQEQAANVALEYLNRNLLEYSSQKNSQKNSTKKLK